MFQMLLGSILSNPDALKYIVLVILIISVFTTIIKKLFKLALALALIAMAANYLIPGVLTTLMHH